MIKTESIESLKQIIDIVDVVGNYVELKKYGSNFKACCPFHAEKNT
jgi:DNA primase